MIIIYACFSGTHASVVAGALHLGWLDPAFMPAWEDLQQLANFDVPQGRGGLRFLGCTGEGCAVYSAAVGNDEQAARCAVQTILPALGWNSNEVLWIDVSWQVSLLWRLGAFLQQYPYFFWLGCLLLRWSLRRDYWIIGSQVKEIIKRLRNKHFSENTSPAQRLQPG